MIALGPVFFHLVYTSRNGLPAQYTVCYRLKPYYIRGKGKASRFDPICFSISGPTLRLLYEDKHGVQNTRVYMGKQNIAEY